MDSLYSFYTGKEIKSGLNINNSEFSINGKPFQIFSGSLHYFRILPERWEESIKKMKHCHLNTVCTYVPWNLHENKPFSFNFVGNLDLTAFIKLIQEQDMFLILRVGPYICAELDLGGLPSWLLRDRNMKLRSNYAPFLDAVKGFYTELATLIYDYQFSVSGGPVIAIQIENEFGSYGNTQTIRGDYEYMIYLKDLLLELGLKELMFTCDMPSVSYQRGSIPDVLMTANFQTDAEKELAILKQFQPNKPLMVAELWSGWFDHWGNKHEEVSVDIYIESLKIILSLNASFNIYVFQGGTNFGFMNGANIGFPLAESPYSSTVTSYDYGALLTESGEYTKKYFATLSLLKSFKKEYQRPDAILETRPLYFGIESIQMTKFLPLNKMLPFATKFISSDPVLAEELGSDCGQRFGFTLYETQFSKNGKLKLCLTRGTRAIVLVNLTVVSVLEQTEDGFHCLEIEHSCQNNFSTLWIFIENLGRVNFTEKSEILNSERRGIIGSVLLNEVPLKNWNIYCLDFSKKFIRDISLLKWEDVDILECTLTIGAYLATLNYNEPEDTYIISSSWNKGIVIVNGFNIGRYWKIGPQQTLFIPKQILKNGLNEIFVFELHSKIKAVSLKDSPIIDTK